MSLIDRLRGLMGNRGAPAAGPAAPPRPAHGERGDVLDLLQAARRVLKAHGALSDGDGALDDQIRYRMERLKQAERMVEREEAGTPAAIRAAEMLGEATQRLGELESWRTAAREVAEGAEPLSRQIEAILADVRAYQDRAQAVNTLLPPEQAAMEAAVTILGRTEPDGTSMEARLRRLVESLQQEVNRAEALRPARG